MLSFYATYSDSKCLLNLSKCLISMSIILLTAFVNHFLDFVTFFPTMNVMRYFKVYCTFVFWGY